MKLFPMIFCIVVFSTCNQLKTDKIDNSNILMPEKLLIAGTKWRSKIAENCFNVYEFKTDSMYSFNSCEMEDTFYGSYSFKQDTLILNEKGSVYDKPNDEHNSTRKKYYAIIANGKLRHLKMYEFFNNKFELSNFKFDDSVYYTQYEGKVPR
jgi:hypothetical protein